MEAKPIILALVLLAVFSSTAYSQNCGCATNECCSKNGYCGTGNDYCGIGCKEGPCNTLSDTSVEANRLTCGCAENQCCSQYGYCGTSQDYCGTGCREGPCNAPSVYIPVAVIITDAFFNGIVDQAASTCAGKGFYTRDVFLNAINSYPQFARNGSIDESKREVAAFFAHATYATGHFCYIEEIDGASKDYCYKGSKQYPCVNGKGYYGRGPLQLTGNVNYGAAGQDMSFDGLKNPEIMARDNLISFKTALWYWMNNCHDIINSGQGFGATIRVINGDLECDGRNSTAVTARVNYYTVYCDQLGVEPGANLRC